MSMTIAWIMLALVVIEFIIGGIILARRRARQNAERQALIEAREKRIASGEELTHQQEDAIEEAKLNENRPSPPPQQEKRCETCAYYLRQIPSYFGVKQDHCCSPLIRLANETRPRKTGYRFHEDGSQEGWGLQSWVMEKKMGWIETLNDSHHDFTGVMGCLGHALEKDLSPEELAVVMKIRADNAPKPKKTKKIREACARCKKDRQHAIQYCTGSGIDHERLCERGMCQQTQKGRLEASA